MEVSSLATPLSHDGYAQFHGFGDLHIVFFALGSYHDLYPFLQRERTVASLDLVHRLPPGFFVRIIGSLPLF